MSALADRGDAAAAPAVRDLLTTSIEEPVHVAAFKALGSLGNASDLALLVKAMASGTDGVREAARASLVKLPGDASTAMVAELASAPSATRVTLLQILTERRARETVPAILQAASGDDCAQHDRQAPRADGRDPARRHGLAQARHQR